MSIINKFLTLNNFIDQKNFYQLICCNKELGYIHKHIVEILISSNLPVELVNKKIIFKGKRLKELNLVFNNVSEILLEKKIIKKLTGEKFPCTDFLGKKEYFYIDRATVEFLGIKGYGVHLTAYMIVKNKLYLWIPIRSKNKRVEPNKYDNTVAGGISSRETVYQALMREAKEEANISKKLIKQAKSVGTISYNWRNKKYSLRRDTLFLFDLEVDKKFIPYCLDGEVANFKLLSWEDVYEKISKTNDFKKNCALVVANFLIRRGLLTTNNEPSYEKICRAMNL